MSSLALLEPEIPYPLDVTGKNNVDVFLALMVAVVAFPLCMDLVEVMVVRLDGTASMGTIRLYDRKTRLGAQALLMSPSDDSDIQDRPYSIICGDSEGTEDDARRLTAMFFLSSKDWDASTCGGGLTVENGDKLDAVLDRIVLLRSDTCSHRQEPWEGDDAEGLEQASCVVVHFVKGETVNSV